MSNEKSGSGAQEGASAGVHMWGILTPRMVEVEIVDDLTHGEFEEQEKKLS